RGIDAIDDRYAVGCDSRELREERVLDLTVQHEAGHGILEGKAVRGTREDDGVRGRAARLGERRGLIVDTEEAGGSVRRTSRAEEIGALHVTNRVLLEGTRAVGRVGGRTRNASGRGDDGEAGGGALRGSDALASRDSVVR